MLAVRPVELLSPLAGLFNLQPPASSGRGLCPFAMSVEDRLLASWAVPLLALAAFGAVSLVIRLSSRYCKSRAHEQEFSAPLAALLLFVFSSLTSTTASLVQASVARLPHSAVRAVSFDRAEW